MKHFFILIAISLFVGCESKDKSQPPLMAMSQGNEDSKNNNQFTFTSHLKGVTEGSKVKLLNYDAFQIVDSTTVKNGQFEFTGEADYPFEAALSIEEGKERLLVQFWIEPGDIFFNSSKAEIINVGADFDSNVKSNKLSTVISKYSAITKKSREFDDKETLIENVYNFFINHADNYFSLSELINYKENYSKQMLQDYFDKLSLYHKQSPKGDILKKYIESSGVNIGEEAPTIVAKNTQGQPIDLSKFRGNYVLLDFWASWCAPCIKKMKKEFPVIKEDFSHKNLKIVSYSFDVDEKMWFQTSKKLGIDWINLSDLTRMSRSSVAFQYGVEEIPTSFLISPEGKILKRIAYDDDIISELNTVLRKAN